MPADRQPAGRKEARTVSTPTPLASDRSALAPADRQLVADCVAGSHQAWAEFVDRFAGLFAFVATRVARQRGRGCDDATRDDMVGEMLLECLRNDAAVLRAFAGRSSLATYLVVIARRVAVRWLTRHPDLAPQAPVTHRSASDDRDTARQQVESLLAGLEQDEARLVRLHHLEQRSYGEISHLTGMPLGSIGPALTRAREKMRRLEQQPHLG